MDDLFGVTELAKTIDLEHDTAAAPGTTIGGIDKSGDGAGETRVENTERKM